ncbi:PspC domain-containing protein [Actinoplanes sp. N902-109]|uniref:PspC domain-containing protein n=1 Tax=Actinoplanes sp. (strain N902-109) TaxID=649831 RepID=UPI0003A8DFB2|nr:PspC domain-containing protein [Actinoplanes sp. N902-109]
MTDHAVPPPPPQGTTPPAPDGPTWSRELLVRPRQGRYIAGVSGAIARATNTDPVLWRVVLAVLGVFGGFGVLVYLLGWLLIPAEGDTASPIESLLGRGRSGMAPVSVVLLSAAVVVVFAFVVNDGFRAAVLAAAVLVGGVLILRRNGRTWPTPAGRPGTAPPFGAPPFGTPPTGGPSMGEPPVAETPMGEPPLAEPPTAAWPPAAWPAGDHAAPSQPFAEPSTLGQPAAEPPTLGQPLAEPSTLGQPAAEQATLGQPGTEPSGAGQPEPPAGGPVTAPLPPRWEPPAGGYQPPFAPHGPFAQQATPPPYAPPPAPPKQPKPPKERSKLGRITFFGLVVVLGVLAAIDNGGASVPVSGYFAAALATIGLGLVVGAWFGRARGLIALAVIAVLGLGISSGVERFGGKVANSSYRPQTLGALADRYDFTIGNATLDLRSLDFTGQTQAVTIAMRVGQVRVLLPENVDTSVNVAMDGGRASLFGQEHDGKDLGTQEITDLGPDGKGGGTLQLSVQMDAGNVEVTR